MLPLMGRYHLLKYCEEDSKINYSRLLESIEAFLCGWESHNYTSQVVYLKNLSTKVHEGKFLCSNIPRLPGSSVSTESFHGTPYLEAILDRRTKDGAVLVKKLLQEALLRESIIVNVKTRPGTATKSELQSMIKTLAKDQSTLLRNKGIIQLAADALIALDEPFCARWDAFISAENISSVNAGDTSQGLAAQIGDLVSKSTSVGSHVQKNGKMETLQGLLCFQDSLLLTMVGYILAGENFPTSGSGGPSSWQEENFLKEAIVDAILENPSTAKLKFLNCLPEELEANLKRQKSEESKAALPYQLDIEDFDDDQWGKWDEETDEDDS